MVLVSVAWDWFSFLAANLFVVFHSGRVVRGLMRGIHGLLYSRWAMLVVASSVCHPLPAIWITVEVGV